MKERIRIGQIGLGYWGKNLLRNFSRISGCTVTRICDADPAVLSDAAAIYRDAAAERDHRTLLAADDVDAVVVATETPLHYDMALQALKAGKHVFVEKPMTRTAAEAKTLLEEAGRRNLRLMVGHLLLYHPAFLYVKKLIDSGELGRVFYLYSMRVNLGIVRRSENAFESLAPHDLSVALAFIDARPVAISAQGSSFLQPGVEDVAFAVLHFEDGRMAHLHTSWLDPHKIRKVTVVGSRKMAVIDDVEGTEKVRLYDKGVDVSPEEATFVDFSSAMTMRSGDIQIPRIDMVEPLFAECDHFVDCVSTGTEPRTDAANGLAVVRLMEAAAESFCTGGARVELA